MHKFKKNIKLNHKIIFFISFSLLVLNSCSKDDSNDDTVQTDTSTIKTFKDVAFSLDQTEGFDAGRYFSTELGKSYKKSQIDAAILPKVDVAFYSGGSSLDYFMSPNDSDYGIKNATLSLFINVPTEPFTVEQFNKIEKSADFDAITIDMDDEESFPDSKTPNVVLFKNAAGKKGAIYIKSVRRVGYDPRIIVDIKIQK